LTGGEPMTERFYVESHPGRRLEDHLIQTYKLAEELSRVNLGEVPPRLLDICLLHDIAKAHGKFQKRLRGKGRFPHAEPSAFIALAMSKDIVTAEVIRCHHTHLTSNFINDIWCNGDYSKIQQVVSEMPMWPGSENLLGLLGLEINQWNQLFPSDDDWEDMLCDIEDSAIPNADLWLEIRILFSLLVTCDRLDAIAGKPEEVDLPVFTDPGKVIDEYVARLKNTPLNDWRKEIRCKVLEHVEKTGLGPGVFTLTLPTGAGKTLLALDIALKTARQEGKKGIFYILPFISIVEQNSAVAREIFSVVQEDHHLAFDSGFQEETSTFERLVSLFRYWRDPVVVSTFAKFWEVIYSPRANDSMSFHRLANAVVVLDEPQTIPARYWKGFGQTLEFLSEKLKTTFILVTATQPGIAKGKELVPGRIMTPKDRFRLNLISVPLEIQQVPSILERFDWLEKNTMIVLNTRRAALKMWFLLSNYFCNSEDFFFLSGWLTPCDRKSIMDRIILLEKASRPRNLVSTQVVEAGVDLDFDLVFRDIAPLDSIVQVAGRCNRHMSGFVGQVVVFEMVDENGKHCARYVYDKVLLNITKAVLGLIDATVSEEVTYLESEVRDILEKYYEKLEDALEDCGPWFEIQKGNWDCISPLIEEPQYESTVLVDRDGSISSTVDELRNMGVDLADRDRRKQIWQQLQEHAISVPEKELEHWYNASGSFIVDDSETTVEKVSPGLWIIKPTGFGKIYRPDIGFIPYEIYREYFEAVE